MTEKIIRYIDSDLAIISGEIVGDLVRCKDCKHWKHSDYGTFCENPYGLHSDTVADDYCSYGERKEKE